MKVAFTLNPSFVQKPIDVKRAFTDDRGLTGSELSLLMFSRVMASRGHEVSVFSNFETEIKHMDVYHGPWRCLTSAEVNRRWDAVIAWIEPMVLADFTDVGVRVFNQQVNDFGYCMGWENHTDIALAPSMSHVKHLAQQCSFDETKWKILPNGCNASMFKPAQHRDLSIIYASSPDRGLHWLLELFPRIKRAVPGVELHIYYTWNGMYERVKDNDNELSHRLRYCNEAIERLKGKNVVHHDSVSKSTLARAMSKARLLTYPCDPISFTEGFSVTTLEGAVSGCVPVVCSSDALGEIYSDYVPMVGTPFDKHKDEYADIVIELLRNDEKYLQAQHKAMTIAPLYGWLGLTTKLESYINEHMSRNT